jgi:SagB-type dehydrogenase family enzyme
MKRPSSTAEAYHRATKYTQEGLQAARHHLDWNRRPSVFKEWRSDRAVALAPYLPWKGTPFGGAGARGNPAAGTLGLAHLSRLLYLTNGATAVVRGAEDEHWFRAAPSAGALYPTEVYLATRGITGLADGIHSYSVREHALVPAWEGGFWEELRSYLFAHESLDRAGIVALLTGVWYRSSWRYQDRAYRRILLDTGHVVGNLVESARLLGLRPFTLAGFQDGALANMMFLDAAEEGVLAAVALPQASSLAGVRVRSSAAYPSPPHPPAEATEPGEIMLRLHQVSNMGGESPFSEGLPVEVATLEALHAGRPPVPLSGCDAALDKDLPEAVRQRRSTRSYSGAAITPAALGELLGWARRPVAAGAAGGSFPEMCDPGLIETYVAVLNVHGVEAGLYYYAPVAHELRLLRAGDFRREVGHVCLGQELGRDAAAAVFHVADLPAALLKYGDRAYRYLHLDAGQLGQRLNLMAVHLGLGVSGIGGFFDDEVNALFGLPESRMVAYITTVGVRGSQ